MLPVLAGLFVAASIGVSAYAGRQTAKATQSQVNLEVEQARLQASEMAFERTKSYRQSISYASALSAMGVGGATGFRGVAAASADALEKDLSSLYRQGEFAAHTGQAMSASAQSQYFANTAGSIIQGVGLAGQLGLFQADTYKKKPVIKKRA